MDENNYLLRDIRSMNVLSTLTVGYPYMAYTDSAIDFHSLHVIINDIIVNGRRNIIEFGSGISTLIMGRLFKVNNIKAKLYSVDDNEGWFHIMQEKIKNEGLEEYITLIYAPLEQITLPAEYNHQLDWYSTSLLENAIKGVTFDMVLVDGPMAYRKDIERSRLPGLLYLKDRLKANCSVFLHDINREGEKSILKDWTQILGKEPIQYSYKLAGFICGDHFTITI